MPRTCCVPLCKSNYKSQSNVVATFSFPKDENRKKLWLDSIHRSNFVVSKYSCVCIFYIFGNQITILLANVPGLTCFQMQFHLYLIIFQNIFRQTLEQVKEKIPLNAGKFFSLLLINNLIVF